MNNLKDDKYDIELRHASGKVEFIGELKPPGGCRFIATPRVILYQGGAYVYNGFNDVNETEVFIWANSVSIQGLF